LAAGRHFSTTKRLMASISIEMGNVGIYARYPTPKISANAMYLPHCGGRPVIPKGPLNRQSNNP
jgi:hypothetical protein